MAADVIPADESRRARELAAADDSPFARAFWDEMARTVADALAPLTLRNQIVVGVSGAARLLNTSEQKVRELLEAGLIAQVPGLTGRKVSIAVVELERFAAVNIDVVRRPLSVAS